ncbi:hypothetical protein AGLY_000502 [Aphis glycines]|uniref:Uncharacterized protein n=1 Tax=Aphis glycines TaxID=307491 RepID=A0A6G0U8M4_APHGL|nr:hypothetical protein AGLY_000502 [Aphis glycines]
MYLLSLSQPPVWPVVLIGCVVKSHAHHNLATDELKNLVFTFPHAVPPATPIKNVLSTNRDKNNILTLRVMTCVLRTRTAFLQQPGILGKNSRPNINKIFTNGNINSIISNSIEKSNKYLMSISSSNVYNFGLGFLPIILFLLFYVCSQNVFCIIIGIPNGRQETIRNSHDNETFLWLGKHHLKSSKKNAKCINFRLRNPKIYLH